MLKRNYRDIISVALLVVAAIVLIVFDFVEISYVSDEAADALIAEAVPRLIVGAALIATIALIGERRVLLPRFRRIHRDILWCLPCFLVVLANFPFSALIGGSASISRCDLIWLLIIKCLSVAIMEESLFRGLVQPLVAGYVRDKRYAALITAAVSSALFAAFHLLNLFAGAGIGATLLQVGYSFLIGAMLSAVLMKTGNIWMGVALHAAFNLGGGIVPELGVGAFQDTCFWIFTAVAGTICAVHIIYYLLKVVQFSYD